MPGEGGQWQRGYCSPSAGIVVVCVYTVDKDGRSLFFHVHMAPKQYLCLSGASRIIIIISSSNSSSSST